MIDYLDWKSPLTLEQVFAGSEAFSYPSFLMSCDSQIVYLSSLKEDKGRSVLMLMSGENTKCITPSPYNLQIKVNEYGGMPYWVFSDSIVFANQADQCLYRQAISEEKYSEKVVFDAPVRISSKPTGSERYMYTDVHELRRGLYLAIVERENLSASHSENGMFIGVVAESEQGRPNVKISSADFYSNLVVNVDGSQIAWVQWDHPNMPWDKTELWVADIKYDNGLLEIVNQRRIILSEDSSENTSICQLIFSLNGRLFFSVDFAGASGSRDFWNVYVYDFLNSRAVAVTSGQAEYGYPHWVYGDHRIVQLSSQTLLTVASTPAGDYFTVIDQESLECIQAPQKPSSIQHLDANGNGVCLALVLAYDGGPSLMKFDFNSIFERPSQQALIKAPELNFAPSTAETYSYKARDGKLTHGFYYAPTNHLERPKTSPDALPPLLVMVHGGPTARAYGHFDLQKQFWTSRGFAVFDVNHRGSSGYGRRFRDALYGQWGELDASDIVDGIQQLVEQGKVDSKRICIRGKSAGGYAVLRALTEYPDVFKVGACYYGIGNLVTLAETTHKFEKHYVDRLVNEVFTPSTASLPVSLFHQRSPINKISQVGSAMIVFQGGLDNVVPPSVAQEVVTALKQAKLDYQYTEYPDEGHGFRQVSNNIDAWGKELQFYRRVLGH